VTTFGNLPPRYRLPGRLVQLSLGLLGVASGWLLGGVFGPGTIRYALTIGPLVQFFLPRLIVRRSVESPHTVPVVPLVSPAGGS
jgi:uncharacterized membrane protein YczE